MTKISVIGDSHSRIFSKTNVFDPYFLGPGSKFNLIQNPKGIKQKVSQILSKIGKDYDYNMLIFGEPSCRYQVDNDHHIYKRNFSRLDVVKEDTLNMIVERYTEIILENKEHNLIICAPISIYKPSINFSFKFSNAIRELCNEENITFIDIKKHIVDSNLNIDSRFKSDQIHSSRAVLPFVATELKNYFKIDLKIDEYLGTVRDLKNEFNYNERFGCYVY